MPSPRLEAALGTSGASDAFAVVGPKGGRDDPRTEAVIGFVSTLTVTLGRAGRGVTTEHCHELTRQLMTIRRTDHLPYQAKLRLNDEDA